MKDVEKPIKIKIQNDNCLIYLKNNELSILDKTKNSKNEDNLYDDIKEMSYSVSNISENYSSKKKRNSKKRINLKEKSEFEISNISIFNSNLKPENSNLKTPLDDNINKLNDNNKNQNSKSLKRKEVNEQDFIENLKSKNFSIKKLNFDSAECDTIQETDTIKKLDSNQNNKQIVQKTTSNIENINKNLHSQFLTNSGIDYIDINFKNKNNNNEINSSDNIINNQKYNKNNIDELFNNKKRKNKIRVNDKNINIIKKEIISTIKYKIECIEKYNNHIMNYRTKPLIYNNNLPIKSSSFSKDREISQNQIVYRKPKEYNKNINNNKYKFKILDKNNKINKNFSYVRKRILNKSLKKYNSEKVLNKTKIIYNISNINPFYFDKHIANNSSNQKDYYNQNDFNNKFYLTNSYFNTNHFYSLFSNSNIFIKKNVLVYNNYLTHLNQEKRKK